MSGKAAAHSEMLSARAEALANCNPAEIVLMDRDELVALQNALGYGSTWGEWLCPAQWLPPTLRNLSKRRVAMPCRDDADSVIWTEFLRLALTRSLVRGPKAGIAACSTVRGELEAAIRLVPLLKARDVTPNRFWSALTVREIEAVTLLAKNLLSTIRFYFNTGYLSDQPVGSPLDDGVTERNRFGEPVRTHKVDMGRQWQPLPDEFVGECGYRVIWFIKTLGPPLLKLFQAVVNAETAPPGPQTRIPGKRASRTTKRATARARNAIIRAWRWEDPNGNEIRELPFDFVMKTRTGHPASAKDGRTFEDFSWPLKGYWDLINFVSLLQSCHAWLLCLLNGPRASSVFSLQEDCLQVQGDGSFRLSGMQYKTRAGRLGRARDWPVPALLVQAIQQQILLSKLVKQLANPDDPGGLGRHIFVAMNKGVLGQELKTINSNLTLLAERFGLLSMLEKGERVHTHRFRKTIARLIALSLTSAQTILMDLFGHDDPEMSLRRYILSDKLILADVQRVQRELVVLLAKDAIDSADELGGMMGGRVRQAIGEYKRVERKSELDPKDVFELAETLTLNGSSWAVVMPGIICALPVGATGPCAQRQGGRDPANCQAGCDHQLLLAFNKTECADNVAWIIANLQRAVDEESATVEMWVGQLENWLYRWSDVYSNWSSHDLVKRFCRQNGSFAGLQV